MEHGVGGLGVFWCIIEQLYEQDGKLPIKFIKNIAFALHVESSMVESIVNDFGLFQSDAESFWSKSVLQRMSEMAEKKQKRINAAKAMHQKRREAESNADAMQMQNTNDTTESDCNADAMQTDSICNSDPKIKENKIKENTKEIDKETVREKRSVFTPPTLEEVKDYVSEKGYSIDPVKFWNFYESKGWMVGKNKMKKWKAAVANWASSENKPSQSPVSGGRGHDGIKHCNDEWQ